MQAGGRGPRQEVPRGAPEEESLPAGRRPRAFDEEQEISRFGRRVGKRWRQELSTPSKSGSWAPSKMRGGSTSTRSSPADSSPTRSGGRYSGSHRRDSSRSRR